jgi:hypothetical protein
MTLEQLKDVEKAMISARAVVAMASRQTEEDHIGDTWLTPLAVSARERLPRIDAALSTLRNEITVLGVAAA